MDSQIILMKIQNYLQKANTHAPGMSEEIIQEAGEQVKAVLRMTFNETRGDKFRIRMSNVGKPTCQLMMERDGADKEAQPYSFRMKMLIGEITELVLKAVILGSGVHIASANEKVALKLDDMITINGSYDLDIGGIWDVKSASRYSYENKFVNFTTLEQDDPFGYCGQLFGYAEASNKRARGWIAVNKETGDIKTVDAIDTPETRKKHLDKLRENVYKLVDLEAPFVRSFQDEEETFYKVPTGNRKLGMSCGFCEYKWSCWEGLQQKQMVKTTSTNPKLVYYTKYDPASAAPHVKAEKPKKEKKV